LPGATLAGALGRGGARAASRRAGERLNGHPAGAEWPEVRGWKMVK